MFSIVYLKPVFIWVYSTFLGRYYSLECDATSTNTNVSNMVFFKTVLGNSSDFLFFYWRRVPDRINRPSVSRWHMYILLYIRPLTTGGSRTYKHRGNCIWLSHRCECKSTSTRSRRWMTVCLKKDKLSPLNANWSLVPLDYI